MILLDIEEPKRCLYCPMIDYTHDLCIVRPKHVGEQISQLEERPDWCPIVEEYDREVWCPVMEEYNSEEEKEK